MGLVKDIFKKFSQHKDFIQNFSNIVYVELIKDQLPDLKTNYTSDKSQLLEILCISWPDHYNTVNNFNIYPEVIPALMDMLTHKSISLDVSCLHMGLLKKLIVDTMDVDEKQSRALKNVIMPET